MEYLQQRPEVQLASDATKYLGSRCKSDRWRTLTRFPLGFGTGYLLGFGFGNKPVVFNGLVDGTAQNEVLRVLQMYCPSSPVTSASAST